MEPQATPDVPAAHLADAKVRALAEAVPALVFVTDPCGLPIFTNRRATAYASVSPGSPGNGWLALVHPAESARAREKWQAAVAAGEPFDGEFRLKRHDGEYRRHACKGEPARDESGGILQWLVACADVEGQQQAEAAARERLEELETLLDTLPVGVWIAHDPDCRHISGNRVGSELLRMSTEANLSKTAGPGDEPRHFRVFQNGRELPAAALPMQRAARGEVVRAEELEHQFTDDGALVHTLVSAQPLFDRAGRPRGAVATILDITSLKSAEAADRRKAEFLAELGHELRNPLAPLARALELCRRSGADPVLVPALLATMQRQIGYLIGLVDDLLDLARATRDDIRLDRSRIELREVLERAIELAKPLIEERRHELVVVGAESTLPLDGDLKRLTQVVANLLSNAAKYTDPGGTIRVHASRENGSAVVRVRDTGFGIPPDQLEAIFRMFTRVPEHRERIGGSGLGIGLALARRVIGLHGGSIEAFSDGPGRGSEFVVRLALADSTVEQPADTPPRAGRPAHPRRVLVVDDNADAAEMMRLWLEMEGHDARVAADGPSALRALDGFSADVVLLDIGLPGMDGYEVARRMRTLRPRMLIAALTGWAQAGDTERSREAGFDEYLTKPARDAQLRALLARPGVRPHV